MTRNRTPGGPGTLLWLWAWIVGGCAEEEGATFACDSLDEGDDCVVGDGGRWDIRTAALVINNRHSAAVLVESTEWCPDEGDSDGTGSVTEESDSQRLCDHVSEYQDYGWNGTDLGDSFYRIKRHALSTGFTLPHSGTASSLEGSTIDRLSAWTCDYVNVTEGGDSPIGQVQTLTGGVATIEEIRGDTAVVSVDFDGARGRFGAQICHVEEGRR